MGEGVYTVKLTLTVTNKNYEIKTVDKTIKIVKTADYDIKFKDNGDLKTTNDDYDLIYDWNQEAIIRNIDSIYTKAVDGVSYKVYPSVIDGDTPTTVISLEQNYGDYTYISEKIDSSDYQKIDKGTSKLNISPDSNSTDHYKITIKVTHKYGTSDSYSYKANDTFDIVRKAASATVSEVTDLVYSGEDQVLATATDIKPDGSDGASIEYKVVKEVDKLTGELNATSYAELIDIYDTDNTKSSVTVPKTKDAGTYYVYYHLKHGNVDNYKDAYGYVTVTIAKKPLTIEGFEDKTIVYDGENHINDLISKPLFKVTGIVKGEEEIAYTITHFNSNVQTTSEYKNAGIYKTKIHATSNYCLSDTDQTKTTVSKTLTINTLEAEIITNKSTSTYYKGHDKKAVIECSGIDDDFDELKLYKPNTDGSYSDSATKTLEKDTDYTVEKGSTKIILKESFLNTLTVGKKYKFELVYTNSPENYSNSSWPTHYLKVKQYVAPSDSSSSSTTSTTTTIAKKVVNTGAY